MYVNINQHSPSEAGKIGLQYNSCIAFLPTTHFSTLIFQEEISEKPEGLGRNQGHPSQREGQVWSREQRDRKKKGTRCEADGHGSSPAGPQVLSVFLVSASSLWF